MDLRARLRGLVSALPAGAAVTLPVDVLRSWLDEDAAGPEVVDLTVQDVGRLLGRAPSTVRTWCGEGRLVGAYRLRNREWRVPRAALRALRDRPSAGEETGPVDLGRWRRVGGGG